MDIQPRQRAVGAAAALAAAFVLSPAAAQAKGFADGFGVRPIKRHGGEVAASYFTLKARPGETLHETAIVSNSSLSPIEFLVDGVDGLTGTTSGVVYANRDDRHLETSRWVRPAKRRLILAPGTSRRFGFELRVPESAEPGDHLAGLAFQDVHEETSRSRLAVRQVVRVVMGVQITVDGGSAAQVELGDLAIQPLPGTQVPSVVLNLRNKGQLLCKPKARVVLTPPSGKPISAEQQLDTILPGNEIKYPLPFKGALASGTYNASASIDGCGAHQQTDVSATLAESLSGTTPLANAPKAADASKSVPLALVGGVGVGGLLVGGIAAVLLLRRRDRKDQPAE